MRVDREGGDEGGEMTREQKRRKEEMQWTKDRERERERRVSRGDRHRDVLLAMLQ